MKTVVMFDNFGHYHLARLGACARVCELTAVEVAARSVEYAWRREARMPGVVERGAYQAARNRNVFHPSATNTSHFRHVTLFECGTSRDVHSSELMRRMNQALDDCRPDVVCVPGWSNHLALAALRWCLQHNVPAVAMSESTEWDDHRVWHKEFVKRQLVGLFAAALVGGMPHKDYIVKLGMPGDRVFLGYDAVDNRYFESKAKEVKKQQAQLRKRYELPEHYFLASARFIKKKNLPRLLEAYALYRKGSELTTNKSAPRSPPSVPWDLVLLGDGPRRPDLRRQISDLQLDTCVHLPGFKQYPDLPVFYGLANVFIHASTTEPWGLVVNEAMASGLPVIVSNRCGCASELVREGENGFTFNPTNKHELSQLMIRMSGNSVDLDAMGQRSREIVQTWSLERFAKSMNAACERAITEPRQQKRRLARVILDMSLRIAAKATTSTRGGRLGIQERLTCRYD